MCPILPDILMEGEAAALGWPKLKYAQVERERRWLVRDMPSNLVVRSTAIEDLYLSDSQLRVRSVRDLSTDALLFKLARKADLAPSKRLITTIYLAAQEHRLLSQLPGARLSKVRHSIRCLDGTSASIDVFKGDLQGLMLAEWEFESDEVMEAYEPPDFVGPEVTADARYCGGALACRGMTTCD